MKEKSIVHKKSMSDKFDKRDLVNIDLYKNEIKVMVEQLNELAEKHQRTKEVHKKLEQLKKELSIQQENLELFRRRCAPEMNLFNEIASNEDATKNESFFEHLSAFEDDFKNVRQEVNEFMNKWL